VNPLAADRRVVGRGGQARFYKAGTGPAMHTQHAANIGTAGLKCESLRRRTSTKAFGDGRTRHRICSERAPRPFGPCNFSDGVNLETILAALVAQVSGLIRLVYPKLHSGFADFVVRYLALSGFRTADHTERFCHLNDPGTAAPGYSWA